MGLHQTPKFYRRISHCTEHPMKQGIKTILVGSAFVCATSLSVGWSDHSNLQLSVASAQARVGRPATPMSVAGVARRHVRRGTYPYVGAGVAAAAAIGTAAAIGSAYNSYYGDPYGAYAYDAAPYGAYGAGPYGGYGYGYGHSGCAPGPRVGAFATQPWNNLPTCPY
jgi:hypothetical protein